MARIKNIDLPKDKAVFIGLTAIYGIGQSTAKKICAAANVDANMKVRDLTLDQEAALRSEVDNYTVEGELRREVQMNIKNKMEIGSYQGSRHKKGLPVHGQRTSRNARTRKGKGKVVANKKKEGNTISWASSGTIGYKGSKKKTPYAAGLAAEQAGKAAMDCGVKKVEVFVKGLGGGRETAIRSLQTAGLEITTINDVTPVPHNGCRPPKRPRN